MFEGRATYVPRGQPLQTLVESSSRGKVHEVRAFCSACTVRESAPSQLRWGLLGMRPTAPPLQRGRPCACGGLEGTALAAHHTKEPA